MNVSAGEYKLNEHDKSLLEEAGCGIMVWPLVSKHGVEKVLSGLVSLLEGFQDVPVTQLRNDLKQALLRYRSSREPAPNEVEP